VQEEPKNAGAWSFIEPRFNNILTTKKKEDIRYIGRPPAASTATGYGRTHEQELREFLREAMS
jgi:2-oxoglutarate dehydrogenase E1 component